ncbi:MAG: 23S rRNA (pseudouridine(1915)-N(3))-methyltransferase RlmH [Bacteroidaceae bacterium]|nr:23S rRNA (pseudouridine(1915)-N(3))-methyltransferase RlmH [Bacteroidaceae bacterium]MBR4594081.1 23S rRNA (pseudouridine(1915)-N(3))-methyltransferase RlmH [Bacteroidaceae bacterium]
MKIILITVGKTDQQWLSDGIRQYTERLSHFCQFEFQVIPDIRNTRSMEASVQKEREGEQILKLLQPSDDVYLLDDKGLEMTSPQMAQWLEKRMSQSTKRLVFIIGGPYGFSPDVYNRVPGRLSLSRMTFSHQMVRLIFVEQLYRAFAILNNLPYHHE